MINTYPILIASLLLVTELDDTAKKIRVIISP